MTWEDQSRVSRPRCQQALAKEARKSPRFSVEMPCLFSGGQGADCSGTVFNLSQGGCAIRSSAPSSRVTIFKF